MVRLVDDLLDVSRISRGKIELRLERLELSTVIHQAVEAAQPFFEASGQELIVEMPAKAIVMTADAARLSQAIGNLLSNASKFNEVGGRVRLSVETDGVHAQVRVSDRGVGMHSDSLLHIFDMFTQLDTSLDRSRGGLGIGLMLVKHLVEMHGGTVRGMSEGLGLGSDFLVRLPVLLDPHPAVTSELPVHSQNRLRILVVDDNADGADVLGLLLQMGGHEVVVARDGLEAIETSASSRFDVVLLDIGLPKHDGYEVARRIRAQYGDAVALIALTGWGQPDDLRQALEAGFDVHVTKPVDIAEITDLLEQVSNGSLGSGREQSSLTGPAAALAGLRSSCLGAAVEPCRSNVLGKLVLDKTPLVDVDTDADVAFEVSVRIVTRRGAVHHPDVAPVLATQPIVEREAAFVRQAEPVDRDTALDIFRMDGVRPQSARQRLR